MTIRDICCNQDPNNKSYSTHTHTHMAKEKTKPTSQYDKSQDKNHFYLFFVRFKNLPIKLTSTMFSINERKMNETKIVWLKYTNCHLKMLRRITIENL